MTIIQKRTSASWRTDKLGASHSESFAEIFQMPDERSYLAVPYAERKSNASYRGFDVGRSLIPLRDTNGRLHNVQFVGKDKFFRKEGWEAAKAVNGKLIAPPLTSKEKAKGLTDWNDIHAERDLKELEEALRQVFLSLSLNRSQDKNLGRSREMAR